jgi:indolepyruvate ferredoxin oxidoreductase beta subunit
MKYDIILGGVGGQGILSIAFVVDNTAMREGLHFKQSEVHGMAQRGGAVMSHLRIADRPIYSDLIPLRSADLVLSVEPMEALRYRDYLGGDGTLVASVQPVVNIPDYPDRAELIQRLLGVGRCVLVNGDRVARAAGSSRASNIGMLGAASPFLPLPVPVMEEFIRQLLGRKGERLVEINLKAFHYGRAHGEFFRRCLEDGAPATLVLELMDHLDAATLEPRAAGPWSRVLASDLAPGLKEIWEGDAEWVIPGDVATPERILVSGLGFLQG